MFRLPRRETIILISGYSLPVRTKIIDRWEALEAQAKGWDPPDTAEAIAKARKSDLLRMALKHAERAEALADENLRLKGKADAYDRFATPTEGSLCFTDAAKTLQVAPAVLFNFVRGHRWIYRRPSGNFDVAYQDKLAAGYLEHKTTSITRSDGSERIVTQVRVTSIGIARLAKELGDPPARLL